MSVDVSQWISLLLRWAHLIVGIAWIGSSFYFVWLDSRLNRPPRDPENERVAGDLWAVHGGGFYHAQKYQVSPERLPEPLHWFKWEAYSTWLTGFALLVITYWLQADLYLLDPAVSALSPGAAVAISGALLVVGWLVYDGLCRLPFGNRGIAAAGVLLLVGLVYGIAQVFSGRGAFMQVGAMLGTMMVANVAMVIIPGQKRMVAALARGDAPDPRDGERGKQRSMHNNYLTLPVLFVMISNHYPFTFGYAWNWLVLLALFAVGAAVRHYFNLRNVGRHVPLLPVAALAGVALLAWATAPRTPAPVTPVADGTPAGVPPTAISLRTAHAIVTQRCAGCHADAPTHPSAPVAPKGVMLHTPELLDRWAAQVYEFTVVNRTMPLANLTGITPEERALIGAWYRGRQQAPANP